MEITPLPDWLVACEESQVVTEALINNGQTAMSCDKFYPGAKGLPHYHGDVLEILYKGFRYMVAHPVCRYLTNSGVKHLVRDGKKINPDRWKELEKAMKFFNTLKNAPIPFICLENPIPHKYARDGFVNDEGEFVEGIGMYTQVIQPWQFGHKEMKATCLWLKGFPKLVPTDIVGPPPKERELRKHWAVVHRMSPGPNRTKMRSRTYEGIAKAIAEQWTNL